ncbi:MAG: TIGR00645 family protein [Gemmatimonadaceae bacterium]|nr:TIGR00645 family protein [Acetobacteraceae bacterium]
MLTRTRLERAERLFEDLLFGSRWLLAPFYLGLALSLILLLLKFAKASFALMVNAFSGNPDDLIVGILGLIDISLTANLVLMVVFAGYENFVSRMDMHDHPDRPEWMGRVNFGDLKLKLMTSIVAISAIHVLEDFMHASTLSDRDLAWRAGLHMLFIVSGVLLALMDRIMHPGGTGGH